MLGTGTKMWVSFGEGHPNTTHVHVPNNNKSEQIYLNSDHDQDSRDMTTK